MCTKEKLDFSTNLYHKIYYYNSKDVDIKFNFI